jgi:hypothetical protein
MALKRWNDTNPIEYEGLVLETRERNGYHDSDFYAVVWDVESKSPKSINYHTTRGASTGWACVDATDEIRAQYTKWCSWINEKNQKIKNLKTKLKPEVGSVVEIFRGRKRKGGVGTVFWMGNRGWGETVGIRFSDEKDGYKWKDSVFVKLDYVRVTNWESIEKQIEELKTKRYES